MRIAVHHPEPKTRRIFEGALMAVFTLSILLASCGGPQPAVPTPRNAQEFREVVVDRSWWMWCKDHMEGFTLKADGSVEVKVEAAGVFHWPFETVCTAGNDSAAQWRWEFVDFENHTQTLRLWTNASANECLLELRFSSDETPLDTLMVDKVVDKVVDKGEPSEFLLLHSAKK